MILGCHRALTGMPPFFVIMEEGRYGLWKLRVDNDDDDIGESPSKPLASRFRACCSQMSRSILEQHAVLPRLVLKLSYILIHGRVGVASKMNELPARAASARRQARIVNKHTNCCYVFCARRPSVSRLRKLQSRPLCTHRCDAGATSAAQDLGPSRRQSERVRTRRQPLLILQLSSSQLSDRKSYGNCPPPQRPSSLRSAIAKGLSRDWS